MQSYRTEKVEKKRERETNKNEEDGKWTWLKYYLREWIIDRLCKLSYMTSFCAFRALCELHFIWWYIISNVAQQFSNVVQRKMAIFTVSLCEIPVLKLQVSLVKFILSIYGSCFRLQFFFFCYSFLSGSVNNPKSHWFNDDQRLTALLQSICILDGDNNQIATYSIAFVTKNLGQIQASDASLTIFEREFMVLLLFFWFH